MNKKRLLKLANFIEKLPNKRLNMNVVALSNAKGKMGYKECGSVACAMGWTPAVFPKLVKWIECSGGNELNVCMTHEEAREWLRGNGSLANNSAMVELFDIPYLDADYIFGLSKSKYHTPKQVAEGIRKYVKTGEIPNEMKYSTEV